MSPPYAMTFLLLASLITSALCTPLVDVQRSPTSGAYDSSEAASALSLSQAHLPPSGPDLHRRVHAAKLTLCLYVCVLVFEMGPPRRPRPLPTPIVTPELNRPPASAKAAETQSVYVCARGEESNTSGLQVMDKDEAYTAAAKTGQSTISACPAGTQLPTEALQAVD